MRHPQGARLWLPTFFVLVSTLVLIRPVAADPASGLRITEVERAGGELVVTVFTPGIPEVPASSFGVTVNDLRADVVSAAPGLEASASVGAVLAIDTSGSMQGRPMEEAKKAVLSFLDSVRATDRVGLVSFSDTARVVSEIGGDEGDLRAGLDVLEASGETAVYDGLLVALKMVEDRPPQERNVILLSDGGDTVSSATYHQILTAARRARATVSVVGIESPEYEADTLAPIARKTGGRMIATDEVSTLPDVFGELARVLVTGYQIRVEDPDPNATIVELEISIAGPDGRLGGQRVVSFPSLEQRSSAGVDLPSPLDVPLPVLLLSVFLASGLLVFFLFDSLKRRRDPIAARISWYDPDPEEDVDPNALISAAVLQRARDIATDLADRTGALERLQASIEMAGMKWRPGEVIVTSVAIGIAAFALASALAGPFIGFGAAAFAATTPFLKISIEASKRRKAFERQLPVVLMQLSGGLRAGYSLQQALTAVASDARPPASEEFRRTMAQVKLGASLDDALKELARRVGLLDLEWTVLAIEIQREVGGDLAEIMEIISETIRERERLRGQLRALTAEGRLSGLVLGALPVVMAVVLTLRSPGYLEPLYTTTKGLFMIGGSLMLMIVGFFWMRKIIRIEV